MKIKIDRILNYLLIIALTILITQQIIINQIDKGNKEKTLCELCKK